MSPPDLAHGLSVVSYPDPVLRETCEPVVADERVREVAKAMLELMYRENGIGLAAPQVGWNARLLVMNPTGEPDGERVVLNPRLVSRRGKAAAEEGCLSLPGIYGKVSRPKEVVVHAQDLSGGEVEIEADGLAARCLQHEMDHLDGVLIIDKFGPARRVAIRNLLRELEEEFEEDQD